MGPRLRSQYERENLTVHKAGRLREEGDHRFDPDGTRGLVRRMIGTEAPKRSLSARDPRRGRKARRSR